MAKRSKHLYTPPAPRVPVADALTPTELGWLQVLAEHAISDAVKAHAVGLLADGVPEVDARAARVAAYAATGWPGVVYEHQPGGIAASEAEVKRARAWRKLPAAMELDNCDGALYLAMLYAVPRAESWQETPRYGPSLAVLADDLAGRLAEIRQRAWTAAWEWTPKGHVLRKGFTDPALEWADSPQASAERAMGVVRSDPREDAGQLRLPHT